MSKLPNHTKEPKVVEAASAKPEVSPKPLYAMGRSIERLKAKKYRKIHKKSLPEGINSFKCNICEIEFLLKANLKRNKIYIHDGKKTFKSKIYDDKASRNSIKRNT